MQKIEDIEENDSNEEIIMMGLHQEDGISEVTFEKHLNKTFLQIFDFIDSNSEFLK